MFVLQKDPSWIWPVSVRYPTDGGHKTGSFRARFRLLTDAELETTVGKPDQWREMLGISVQELLDLEDEAGQPIPHSPELLKAVLEVPYLKIGLREAYITSVTSAPEKN